MEELKQSISEGNVGDVRKLLLDATVQGYIGVQGTDDVLLLAVKFVVCARSRGDGEGCDGGEGGDDDVKQWLNKHGEKVEERLDVLNALLEMKFDRTSGMLWAAEHDNNGDILTLLLKGGNVDPNFANLDGWTPLLYVANKGHTQMVAELLGDERVDPNMTDTDGHTPLWYAAHNGHTEVVKALLADARVDPNIFNQSRFTPLNTAYLENKPEAVEALLADPRVDPNIPTFMGYTMLHHAITRKDYDLVSRLMKDERIDLDAHTQYSDETATMIATRLKDSRMIRLLGDSKEGSWYHSPRQYPMEDGEAMPVQKFTQNRRVFATPDPNSITTTGLTALMFAAEDGNTETVKALLADERVDPNIVNFWGETALTIAVEEGREDVVNALLDDKRVGIVAIVRAATKIATNIAAGHAENAADMDRQVMMERRYVEILARLLEGTRNIEETEKNEKKMTSLLIAADFGHTIMVEMLLNAGANPNTRDSYQNTAILLAADHGHMDVYQLLLNAGANPTDANGIGNTPLHAAVINSRYEMLMELLTDKRVNINAVNKQKKTPLMCAVEVCGKENIDDDDEDEQDGDEERRQVNRYDIIEALLKAEAELNVIDDDDNTALILAAMNENAKVVKMLLDAGADPNILDNEGKTALMVAKVQEAAE